MVAMLVAMTCAASAPGSTAFASRPRAAPPLIVLVVAGQSNALGYQSFVIDPTTHKDVFTGSGSSAADRKVRFTFQESGVAGGMLPPLPLDAPQKRSGASSPIFGPEVGLARYLYNAGHKNLLVVKVAFSGSSLAADWSARSVDFGLLQSRVQAAMSWATENGWSPSIGGFYWMQGESDAENSVYAADYRKNLVQFIANVRADIPLKLTTPIVVGQIDLADYIHFEQVHHLCSTKYCTPQQLWNSEVMKAQSSVAGKHIFIAKTAKLPRYQDFLHLTDAAELTLGKEFGSLSRAQV
jgi:Carbohydrate esterase, sialic acid-specific acetylesterase